MKQIILASIMALALILIGSCSQNTSVQSEKERFVDSLLSMMTIDEKIGQMTLYTSGWTVTGPTLNPDYEKDIKAGKCGNIFNALTADYNIKLQKMAVEETRLGIPLLFGYDAIHGFRTIYPIPLAEACSWDMDLIEKSAQLTAKEAAAEGINWNYSPMVDIARDPRWGRVSEGAGEDPYLGSLIAAAKVHGYQGDSLNSPFTQAACVKHFAAYGAPVAGRDYNTVDMSERLLRDIYLVPYKAAIDAGAATVMSSFNELDGIPATGNKHLMTEILRGEWGFKGFVVTDYTSINEMVAHGFATDNKHAGELALNAGIDMDMQSGAYANYLKELITEGKITDGQLNIAAKRILELKYDLGLFKDPYLYLDKNREKETLFSDEMMEHALIAAEKSIVLLKNEAFNGKKLLPLDKSVKNIALIGPLADNQIDLLGSWHASGDETKVTTVLKALQNKYPNANIKYAKGADFNGNDKSGFAAAINLARNSDIIICAIGENYQQSGEAASRSNIGLPGVQQELMEELVKTGKPIIATIWAGRPLTIEWLNENVAGIVYAWHLGTKAGEAIANIISGDYNPSAKLVISFPRNVGQIPIYYNAKNTGRPFDANDKYRSKYLDVSNEPLYPFGYGLSYTTFEYSDLKLDKNTIAMDGQITASFKLKNTGQYDGEEIAQLYIRDLVGSVTRPVKELKAFKKVMLKAGEETEISFTLSTNDLKFYDAQMRYTAEAGKFKLFVGGNSVDLLEADFELTSEKK